MPITSGNTTNQGSVSSSSPNTLPAKGYTNDQLKDYIFRQLGAPTWDVELTAQQVLDTIQDSLTFYSQWRPRPKYGAIRLTRGVFAYLQDAEVGFGVVQVDFVEPNPVPTELFYGNLIDPAPLFRTGLDEYDTFLRWRKTWQRVTSVRPDWLYDEFEHALYIHNPIERFHAGVLCHFPFDKTEQLDPTGAVWVKEYALEKARYLYGETMSKFSGAIPGPVKDLQLDSQKRDKAIARIEKLEERLKASQFVVPVSID